MGGVWVEAPLRRAVRIAGCRGIGAGRKRSRAVTARRGAETGGPGAGSGRCVSRSTLATTASPPEGPGWGSTSPAR
eukprot:1127768-Pleurochrysis_carterae.AAC.1